jgi:hypothetical protein
LISARADGRSQQEPTVDPSKSRRSIPTEGRRGEKLKAFVDDRPSVVPRFGADHSPRIGEPGRRRQRWTACATSTRRRSSKQWNTRPSQRTGRWEPEAGERVDNTKHSDALVDQGDEGPSVKPTILWSWSSGRATWGRLWVDVWKNVISPASAGRTPSPSHRATQPHGRKQASRSVGSRGLGVHARQGT